MFNTRLNRNIIATAFATLFLYGLAIAPANGAVRKEMGAIIQTQNTDCKQQGNSELPALRVAPAGTSPTQYPVGVPLNTKLNDRIG